MMIDKYIKSGIPGKWNYKVVTKVAVLEVLKEFEIYSREIEKKLKSGTFKVYHSKSTGNYYINIEKEAFQSYDEKSTSIPQ